MTDDRLPSEHYRIESSHPRYSRLLPSTSLQVAVLMICPLPWLWPPKRSPLPQARKSHVVRITDRRSGVPARRGRAIGTPVPRDAALDPTQTAVWRPRVWRMPHAVRLRFLGWVLLLAGAKYCGLPLAAPPAPARKALKARHAAALAHWPQRLSAGIVHQSFQSRDGLRGESLPYWTTTFAAVVDAGARRPHWCDVADPPFNTNAAIVSQGAPATRVWRCTSAQAEQPVRTPTRWSWTGASDVRLCLSLRSRPGHGLPGPRHVRRLPALRWRRVPIDARRTPAPELAPTPTG